MEESVDQGKPNLKICISNDPSGSTTEKNIVGKAIWAGAKSGNAMEFEPTRADGILSPRESRPILSDIEGDWFKGGEETLENKSGNANIPNKDSQEKRCIRAKRFGLEDVPKNLSQAHLKKLYASLGIKSSSLKKHNERGIRLEAIHIRGVDDMNTKDVFNYFDNYAAGGIEWIDDSSCNVVWLDKMTAARAMLATTYEPGDQDVNADDDEDDDDSVDEDGDEEGEAGEEGDKKEETKDADVEMEITKRKLSEDDDDFDLMSDDDEEAEDAVGEKKDDAKDKTQNDDDNSDSKMEVEDVEERPKRTLAERMTMPPGKWRIGEPVPKAKYLFLRFATKADKKLPGAEKRSLYYRKYGNPNFGGIKGLISPSKKRKLRTADRSLEKSESSKEKQETSFVSVQKAPGLQLYTKSKDTQRLKNEPEVSAEEDYKRFVQEREKKKRVGGVKNDESKSSLQLYTKSKDTARLRNQISEDEKEESSAEEEEEEEEEGEAVRQVMPAAPVPKSQVRKRKRKISPEGSDEEEQGYRRVSPIKPSTQLKQDEELRVIHAASSSEDSDTGIEVDDDDDNDDSPVIVYEDEHEPDVYVPPPPKRVARPAVYSPKKAASRPVRMMRMHADDLEAELKTKRVHTVSPPQPVVRPRQPVPRARPVTASPRQHAVQARIEPRAPITADSSPPRRKHSTPSQPVRSLAVRALVEAQDRRDGRVRSKERSYGNLHRRLGSFSHQEPRREDASKGNNARKRLQELKQGGQTMASDRMVSSSRQTTQQNVSDLRGRLGSRDDHNFSRLKVNVLGR